MLKFYVETINRLGRSTEFFSERMKDRKDQDGFASAETIALAVAGVLIAGVAYNLFRGAINDWFSRITDEVSNF